jgi:hypothetical protein
MSSQPSLQGSHKGGEHEHQHVQSVGMETQGLSLSACRLFGQPQALFGCRPTFLVGSVAVCDEL